MFWLEEGLPTSLQPGTRPCTTLTPSMAEKDGVRIAFGIPGGDQRDQWQLIWFLRMVHFGLGMQAGIDAPLFHTQHFNASFYPRGAKPGVLRVEPSLSEVSITALRARGHLVIVADAWAKGRMTATKREADGMLTDTATSRLMQAYAIGR